MSRAPRKAAAPAVPALVVGDGIPFVPGPEIGRGGEGVVHATDDAGIVAKLYANPSAGAAGKLAAMLPLAPAMRAFAAWPADLVRDAATGAVVGFTMRRAPGEHDVHDLYNVKSRRRHFPKADWRFLVHVAANACRAFAAVHAAGCVVGDVNHGGIRIAADGTVTLIDCDSFQVASEGRTHRCLVGVDTFTPPELQGVAFAGVDRTTNHDGFGLAVLVFQLLFLGRHPYIGIFSGPGDMDPAKAIREDRFAFGADAGRFLMRPPPGSVGMDAAGPEAAALFERAFSPAARHGGRPSPREWIEALSRLEAGLVACKDDPGHWHRPGEDCPWCRLERGSGVQLFPLAVRRLAGSLFDAVGFRLALDAIPDPGPAPAIEDFRPAPGPGIARIRKRGKVVAALAMGVTLAAAFALWSLVLLAASFAVYGLARYLLRGRRQVKDLRAVAYRADAAWQSVLREWTRRAGPGRFREVRARIDARLKEWEALPAEHERRMRRLTSNLEVDQRARYLDRFPIASATIEGIGAIRTQALESFGVSTAADVEEDAVLAVPGFGPARYEVLRRWRAGIEKGFRFDPARGVDPRDVANAEAEALRNRDRIEVELAGALAELRTVSRSVEAARIDLLPAVREAALERAQALADHAAVV